MSLNLLNAEEASNTQKRCFDFYGIALEAWDDYVLLKRKSGVWLCHKSIIDRNLFAEVDTVGLRVFSGESYPYKPTQAFFGHFAAFMTKGFIDLDDQQTNSFMHRNDIMLTAEMKGYVPVRNKGRFVGIGLAKGLTLVSQVPKKIGNQLIKI